jgi:hypothetical protein
MDMIKMIVRVESLKEKELLVPFESGESERVVLSTEYVLNSRPFLLIRITN